MLATIFQYLYHHLQGRSLSDYWEIGIFHFQKIVKAQLLVLGSFQIVLEQNVSISNLVVALATK